MTIQRVQIKNFQPIEDLRIKLDSKITSIIGPTDTGKSSIIRAIRWNAINRPLGDGFVRHGTKETSVSIWTDKGKIKRIKGKENKYEIDSQELKAIGTDVPEQVSQSLKIDELNFQGQHESPFWFDLTAGEVAKRLNDIVDLGLIDQTMANLASRHRKTKSECDVYESQLEEAKQELDSLDFVGELDKELKAVEDLWQKCSETSDKAGRLAFLLDKHSEAQDRLKALRKAQKASEKVLEKGNRVIQIEEKLNRLRFLVTSANTIKKVAEYKIPDISNLEKLMDKAVQLRDKVDKLTDCIRVAQGWKTRISETKKELIELKKKLEEMTEGKCPLCGNEMEIDKCLM